MGYGRLERAIAPNRRSYGYTGVERATYACDHQCHPRSGKVDIPKIEGETNAEKEECEM